MHNVFIFAEYFKTKSMKKFFFVVLMFVAGNVFCQTSQSTALDKEQEKKVKSIHKQVQKQHDEVINHPTMSAEEKKSRIYATKDERDAQLADVMTPEQAAAVKAKDPVNWDKAISKVDKQESTKRKAERDQKLKEVDKQAKDLDSQQGDVKKQMDDLKRKQKDLDEQQKALKQQKKDINAQYK